LIASPSAAMPAMPYYFLFSGHFIVDTPHLIIITFADISFSFMPRCPLSFA